MRRSIPSAAAAAALILLPLQGLASQEPGLVFEMTTVDHTRSGEPEVGLLQVSGPDVAMAVTAGEGRGRMIFRGEAREMVIVDDSDRSYMTLDEARLASMAEQMNAAMAQMEQMLESLPPEQRAMVERMREQGMPGMPEMPGMGPPPEIEVRATGRSDTRSGFPVREYEVLEDGAVARRVWVTPWSEVEGGEEVRDAMVGMVEFFDDFLEALPRMPGEGEAGIRNPFRYLDMAAGMPVVSQELGPEGSVERESTVTSVERRPLDPSTFQPPEGYTRRALPGG